MKMMLIGLGKHDGAKIYHRAIQDYSFQEIVRAVAKVVLERCQVACGLAIIENPYDETGRSKRSRPRSSMHAKSSCWPTNRGYRDCRSRRLTY